MFSEIADPVSYIVQLLQSAKTSHSSSTNDFGHFRWHYWSSSHFNHWNNTTDQLVMSVTAHNTTDQPVMLVSANNTTNQLVVSVTANKTTNQLVMSVAAICTPDQRMNSDGHCLLSPETISCWRQSAHQKKLATRLFQPIQSSQISKFSQFS